MKQEQKELLLKDLCARLPYGVKCQVQEDEFIYIGTLCRLEIDSKNGNLLDFTESMSGLDCQVYLSEVKPYLFPLSSMTEEQKKKLFKLCEFCIQEDWEGKKSEVYAIEIASRFDPAYCYDNNFNLWNIDMRAIEWLLKNHFDIYGLIPMELAIDATGLNIY